MIARDSRYSIEAYAFVLESLNLARNRKLKERQKRDRARRPGPGRRPQPERPGKPPRGSGPCDRPRALPGAGELALRSYGMMAVTVLDLWGIRSTSDIGEIVFNLIDSGDLDKTPSDKRSDFDDVFDFASALRPKSFLRDVGP